MCRPRYYRVAYEINPWMKVRHPVERDQAAAQWEVLYKTLRGLPGVKVKLIPHARGWPDMVFTANGGLVFDRSVVIPNFRYPQRQGEARHFGAWFGKKGYRLIRIPSRFQFEGEGDALKLGDTWFFGYHFRSDISSHQWLSEKLKARVLSLELVDKRFYHLDTCFLPLSDSSCLYYPKAFDPYARKLIERYVPNPVAVGLRDALKFVCNAIAVGKRLVVHKGVSRPLRRTLEKMGFRFIELELGEFLKAGGSAKCLVLRL
ncbi:MAG: amidinotransferase [Candidatus Omnitrophica bacterium]|nr:amidinotransferase [Candidatus Omnitrophota bacterium]